MTLADLRQLVELTPLPPLTDDVDELLAAFTAMYDARHEVLRFAPGEVPSGEEARRLVHELSLRDSAWAAALGTALDKVGAARTNASRLRGYSR